MPAIAQMTAHRDVFFAGWRQAGFVNTVLIWIMATLVVTLLFCSAWRLGSGWSSIVDTTIFFTGDCSKASRANIAAHVALNTVATLVLASSNFFMQVLCSPTREDVDGAHRKNHFLEIGVQSVKNLWFIPRVKVALWLILAATSVPLHLLFNSCLTESRASTDMQLIVGSEVFLSEAKYYFPGAGLERSWEAHDYYDDRDVYN